MSIRGGGLARQTSKRNSAEALASWFAEVGVALNSSQVAQFALRSMPIFSALAQFALRSMPVFSALAQFALRSMLFFQRLRNLHLRIGKSSICGALFENFFPRCAIGRFKKNFFFLKTRYHPLKS